MKIINQILLLMLATVSAFTQDLGTFHIQQGDVYFEKGQYDKAIDCYNTAIAIDKKDDLAYAYRARTKNMLKDEKGALEDYTKAIELNPKNAMAYCNRGAIKASQKKYDEAIIDIDQSIAIDPDSADMAYYNKGRIYQQLNKHAEALLFFEKSITLNSTYTDAYWFRGYSHYILGQYEKAMNDYNSYIQRKPNLANGYWGRSDVYAALHEPERAIADLEKSLQIDSSSIEALSTLAFLKMDLGQYEEAAQLFKVMIRRKPAHASGYNNLGYAVFKTGNVKAGLAYVNQSLKLDANNSYAYRNLALIALAQNNTIEACKQIQQALDKGYTKDYGNEVLGLQQKYCK